MNTSPATIVVVEDDRDTAEFLCEFFAMEGIAVVTCPPGAEARTCVAQNRAKAVILDIYLDGMTGVDILRQLRATPTTQATPVIFFSGSQETLRELMPDYSDYGATFVRKPNVLQLRQVVEGLVRQSS